MGGRLQQQYLQASISTSANDLSKAPRSWKIFVTSSVEVAMTD